MRIVTDVMSPEAAQLLVAQVFSFDVETDTNQLHWDTRGKRGLSYVADVSEIGFYAGEDWTLILSAQSEMADYAIEVSERDAEGHLFNSLRQYKALKWSFKPEDEEFILAMFSRDDEVTAIAHNLVFDARQVFGKFELEVKDNYTL
jgi:hypothetical protein